MNKPLRITENYDAIILLNANRIKDPNLVKVCKETGITINTVYRITEALEDSGLIETGRYGRTRQVTVTEKGKRICELLNKLKMELA